MEWRITGEHLKKVNPNWTFEKWSYRHSFVAKMKYLEKFLLKQNKNLKILDVGSGQGLLVKKFDELGYDIKGLDKEYSSDLVIKDDIFKTKLKDESYDLILCLDVIEHFNISDQERLVKVLHNVLKKNGRIVFSIPNMAHLSSRLFFLFTGKLIRTAKVEYHPGDRPSFEYKQLFKKYFKIEGAKGISPTIPILFQFTQLWPHLTKWLYLLIKWMAIPGWCFNVIFVCRKE